MERREIRKDRGGKGRTVWREEREEERGGMRKRRRK